MRQGSAKPAQSAEDERVWRDLSLAVEVTEAEEATVTEAIGRAVESLGFRWSGVVSSVPDTYGKRFSARGFLDEHVGTPIHPTTVLVAGAVEFDVPLSEGKVIEPEGTLDALGPRATELGVSDEGSLPAAPSSTDDEPCHTPQYEASPPPAIEGQVPHIDGSVSDAGVTSAQNDARDQRPDR